LLVDAVLMVLLLGLAQVLESGLVWRSQPVRIALLWAPLVFFWWAYTWAARTLHLFFPPDSSFDRTLIAWEDRWFGQPAQWLARGRSAWLNDLMHLLYNTYYLYSFSLGAYLHWTGRLLDFQASVLAVSMGYATVYSLFGLLPVWGPRWGLVQAGRLSAEDTMLKGGWMTRLTNRVMYKGPAVKGGAMPSAHSSTAVVFLIWCWRLWGATGGVPATLVVAGMWIGAVYGRYHYVVDIVVGGLLGLAAVLLTDWLLL
jgi:hypothetical protein